MGRRLPLIAAPLRDAGEVEPLIGLITAVRVDGALNLYDEEDSVSWGDAAGEATRRRRALRTYLTDHWSAPTVLVGEAPGQHGARRSGVPFTSLRQLTGSGPVEATATVVQRVLAELGLDRQVLLWNVSLLFPPGNRAPRRVEVEASAEILKRICRGRSVLAIGRHAERATGAPYLRHPSYGGARLFASGLRVALGPVPERQ